MVLRVIRRIHMYLALFLTPWMLMYALSTVAMNHRESLKALYGGENPEFVTEREEVYAGSFRDGADRKAVAEQLLNDLDLPGAYNVRGKLEGRLTINRADPVTPRRILFTPQSGELKVQRLEYRTPNFLERMHRRRGYQHDLLLEDTWAFSVDLAIVAMVFWVASGIWMWWELKTTRRWGGVCIAGGFLLFGLFLVTI